MLEGRKFVIIMGAARSGTTWLQAMLAAHQSIVTRSELWFFSNYTAPLLNTWEFQRKASENGHPIGLPSLLEREQFIEHLRYITERVYSELVKLNPEASIILDKTPGYVYHTAHIKELIPDVHFIHIIRDGRDVVASRLAAHRTWWKFSQKTSSHHIAEDWCKSVKKGQSAQAYFGQYTEIRYEDLLDNGIQTLSMVFNDIGLRVEQSWLEQIYGEHSFDKMRENYSQTNHSEQERAGIFRPVRDFYRKGKAGTWQQDLNPIEKFKTYRVAQALLEELGYVDNSCWWSDNLIMRLSIPSFVGISERVAKFLRLQAN